MTAPYCCLRERQIGAGSGPGGHPNICDAGSRPLRGGASLRSATECEHPAPIAITRMGSFILPPRTVPEPKIKVPLGKQRRCRHAAQNRAIRASERHLVADASENGQLRRFLKPG